MRQTYYALRDCLSYGVNLRNMTTSTDAHPDINLSEFVDADDQDRLEDFEAE